MMMAHTTPIPPHGLSEIVKAPPVEEVVPDVAIETRELVFSQDMTDSVSIACVTEKVQQKPIHPTSSLQQSYPFQPTAPDLHLLQDLLPLDRLLITKKLRVRNVIFLKGKRNRYLVRTSDENLVYTIEEENSWWAGYFCYGLRPLQLTVTNTQGSEVMRIQRPYACTSRVLPCQLQRLEVYSPPEQLLGSVEQQWSAVKPIYLVKNANGDHKFWIRGPFMTVSCFCDVQFEIMRADGTPVGATCKRWQGLKHALFFAPVQDNFGVAFESNLTVEEKGLLLAATLLMDFMYYDA